MELRTRNYFAFVPFILSATLTLRTASSAGAASIEKTTADLQKIFGLSEPPDAATVRPNDY